MSISRRYHFHLPGVVFIAITLMICIAAMNSQRNLLFWIFGGMLAAILISGIVSGWMMMRLRIRRLDPRQGAVDEALVVQYAIENRSRFLPAFDLHVEDLEDDNSGWSSLRRGHAWILHIGPRETAHAEAVFWPTRRGPINFNRIRVRTTFPFGIVKKSITVEQAHRTLIFPKLYTLKENVLHHVAPPGPAGARVSTRPGPLDDYYGLREYREGDSLRHIAWKRLASTDQLVSIERSTPNPPRLRIVLNLTVPTDKLKVDPKRETITPRDLEEQSISLAASIVHAAIDAGYEVGCSVLGTPSPRIPVRRNLWHRDKIMSALAAIDLDENRLPVDPNESPDNERSAVVVIHPDRVGLDIGPEECIHLKGRQLDSLTDGPLGWTEALARDMGRKMVPTANEPAAEAVA